MPLEKQVCNLELSQRLKELGVKQESLFYWIQNWDSDAELRKKWWCITMKPSDALGDEEFSAFTVAELGEMLLARIEVSEYSGFKEKGVACLTVLKHRGWEVKYVIYRNGTGYILGGYDDFYSGKKGGVHNADTEADARAKCLIYLL